MSAHDRKKGSKQRDDVTERKAMPSATNARPGDSPRGTTPDARIATSGHRQSSVNPSVAGGQGGAASGFGGSEQGERGGPGTQQAGWSARQQAQRMQARAEEARQGLPQQSGYGGAEQKQHAGSQESPIGPAGSEQSAKPGPREAGAPRAPSGTTKDMHTDSGSKKTS